MVMSSMSRDRIAQISEHLAAVMRGVTDAVHLAIEVPEMAEDLSDLFNLHQNAATCVQLYRERNTQEDWEENSQCTQ